jgi:hypothetical protein
MSQRPAVRRTLGWVLVILAATFVGGVATGRILIRSPGGPSVPAGDPYRIADVIEQLELAPSQRSAVDEILQRRGGQTDSLVQGVMTGLRAIVDSTSSEIRAVLNDDQRSTFDSLLTIERSRIRMRRPRPSAPDNRAPENRR